MSIPITRGNKKLPKSTAVLNITPASVCVSRILGMCQLDKCGVGSGRCYALKAERMYHDVIPHRMKQMEWWDDSWVHSLRTLCKWLRSRKTPVKAIRVGESGDFRHAGDVRKLCFLANELYARFPTLTLYCYTARKDLFDPVALAGMPPSVVINGSGWMAHNNFVTLAGNQAGTKVDCMCPGDCRKCSRCLERRGKTIGAKLH